MKIRIVRWPALMIFWNDTPVSSRIRRTGLGLLFRLPTCGVIVLGIGNHDQD